MTAPEATRVAWSTWRDTICSLVERQHLTVDGLKAVRRELRGAGRWRASAVPESHREQHAVVLDLVAKAIIAASDVKLRASLATYYASAGDLLGAS